MAYSMEKACWVHTMWECRAAQEGSHPREGNKDKGTSYQVLLGYIVKKGALGLQSKMEPISD